MICVSIGRGRHRHVIAEHKHVADNGIGLVELRLDYIQGTVSVQRLLADRPCPVIVTCRRSDDLGRWKGSEDERVMVLRTAIAEGADWVDLEDDIARTIPRYGKTKRIISYHNFHRTPEDLGALHASLAALDADVVKIATMANHPEDNLRMLELIRESTVPTVGICMGDIGTPSRILAGSVGAPFTYATLSDDRAMAPGQLSWKQMRDLYRYDRITPQTKIYGLIADPISHSYSPIVHNTALAIADIDAVYLPFRVPAEDLEEFIRTSSKWPLAGLSVTIPHKETVLQRVDISDELVSEIGATNTLAFRPDGLAAFNSDVLAAGRSIDEAIASGDAQSAGTHFWQAERDAVQMESSGGLSRRPTLILGAGGVARAIAFALKRQGGEVTIASRSIERARKVAADIGCKAIDWSARHRVPFELLVNATPVGMHPNVAETPFEMESMRPYMIIFDTIYNPENTLLIKNAKSLGCRIITGVDMFVRQAAMQFSIWHGIDAPESDMRLALKQATASYKQPS